MVNAQRRKGQCVWNDLIHNQIVLFSYCQIGCGGYANRSFGHLQIGSNRGSSYVTCTFVVGRVGINQAVALVWIQDLYLSYYRYCVLSQIIYMYRFVTRFFELCSLLVCFNGFSKPKWNTGGIFISIARACCASSHSYASFVLSKFPSYFIFRHTHAYA